MIGEKKSLKKLSDELGDGETIISSVGVISDSDNNKPSGVLAVTPQRLVFCSSTMGSKHVTSFMLSQVAAISVSKNLLQAKITVSLNAGNATYIAKYRAAEEFAQIARETVSAFHR